METIRQRAHSNERAPEVPAFHRQSARETSPPVMSCPTTPVATPPFAPTCPQCAAFQPSAAMEIVTTGNPDVDPWPPAVTPPAPVYLYNIRLHCRLGSGRRQSGSFNRAPRHRKDQHSSQRDHCQYRFHDISPVAIGKSSSQMRHSRRQMTSRR